MLCRNAWQFLFDGLHEKEMSLEVLFNAVQNCIGDEERARASLWEWKTAKLKDVMTQNSSKTGKEYLELLISRLTDIKTY